MKQVSQEPTAEVYACIQALPVGKQHKKLFALKNAKEDQWIKIGVQGEWEGHSNGAFTLTVALFEQMIANFTNGSIDLVVDYEHSTLHEPKAPASGWISREPLHLKVEEEALWAKIVWTEEARKHIEAKEYRYLSPVFIFETSDRSTGKNIGATLHSVALTNTPFLEELGVIANKQTHTKEDTMDETLQEQLDSANATIATQKATITELETKLGKFAQQANASKVETAIANGKITQEQKVWALAYVAKDADGFDGFLATQTQQTQEQTPDYSGVMFPNSASAKTDEPINMTKV